jgi:excisionase family DNA binding protein
MHRIAYSVGEAAEMINVSEPFMRKLIATGRIRSARVTAENGKKGRRLVSHAALEDYIEAREREEATT